MYQRYVSVWDLVFSNQMTTFAIFNAYIKITAVSTGNEIRAKIKLSKTDRKSSGPNKHLKINISAFHALIVFFCNWTEFIKTDQLFVCRCSGI